MSHGTWLDESWAFAIAADFRVLRGEAGRSTARLGCFLGYGAR
jgi:hypothetical protein